MIESTKTPRRKNCFKVSTIVFFFFLIVILTSNQVLGMKIDNTKSFDSKVGSYGKYEIKDWFGLQKLQDVELKSNTETCFWKYCSAEKEITLYQKGSLIDEVRFYDGNELVNIESYEFYIKDGEKKISYTPGKELSPGTYTLILEGTIEPTKIIDWQIKIGGKFWTEEWALWSGGDAPIGYWGFDETTGTNVSNSIKADEFGTLNTTGSNVWTTGIINNGIDLNTTTYMNVTNITKMPSGNQNWSVSVWVNPDTWDTGNPTIIKWGSETPAIGGDYCKLYFTSDGNGQVGINCFGTKNLVSATSDLSGSWHHIVGVYNENRNVSIYLDGFINASAILDGDLVVEGGKSIYVGRYITASLGMFDGQIDELGIWNRTLSSDEVIELYNSGAGLPFEGEFVKLNFPLNNALTNLNNVMLNASLTSSVGKELRNATINIWYPNETLFILKSKVISGATNETNFNISDFSPGEFKWNIQACSNDSTPTNICIFAGSNRTLFWNGFKVIGEKWENLTIEGNTETFNLNITLNPGFQISSATLVYNNTNNLGSFTNTGGSNYSISKSISVPAVSTQTNVSFYWSILLDSETETNTTTHNQTINNIGIDDCSTNTVMILNYSLRDEEDRDFLNGTLFNTTIEIDVDISPLGTTTSIINFSKTFTKKNPASVCLSINLSNTRYRMDVTTRYESQDRISEFHHIQNNTLTNLTIPININLHDLKTVDSTTFLITFENKDFLPEENALIDITRKYIGDGIFRSVEIGKTDANGQTLGHFVVSDATYTIIVSKEGTILATFENILAVCRDAVIGDCKISLNAFSTSRPLEDFRRSGGITHTGLNFDKDARTITTSFTSTTGETVTVLLNATKFDRFGKTQVCSDSLTSSAGSLTCNIPASLGNITIIADLFSNNLLISTEIFTINPDARANWGTAYSTAVFMGILAIDTIALMFISSPVGILIGALLGLILVSILVIINSSSILGTSSALIWFIVAIAIVVYKIVQRKR